MHNNYYFFQQLIPELSSKLVGSVLTGCFSQNKDELILEFRLNTEEYFFIKASLQSQFSCLSFPTKHHRAKRNSINLFDSVRRQMLNTIKLYANERAFVLNFENDDQLLFKLYGNKSNIIHFKNNKVVELFKSNLKHDKEIDLNQLDRNLDISYQTLKSLDWDIRKMIPTLDKRTAQLLSERLSNSTNKETVFDNFLHELNSSTFYIDLENSGYRFNLIKTNLAHLSFTNPLTAITKFFKLEARQKSLNFIKSRLIAPINSQLTKSDNYIKKISIKLNELSKESSNKQKADVLMANLHIAAKGSKSIELFNFYTNTAIIIRLNPLQTLQKNAERYYRKAKNEAKEISVLSNNIKLKEQSIKVLKQKLLKIENSSDFRFLQNQIPKLPVTKIEHPIAYKEFVIDEYKILVGKNAKHNDTLTLKIAKKDDLWLHAKDVSGSHVVIKQIPGRVYPAYIIEKAAQLAAFYSKRKTDSLCPVLYTPKKYVRKKKGTPAGAVFVEKEKVVLVVPSNNI
ncbi:MAG: NFACT RNA binding domain-containing protein [Cyclobacteriaceae bacterium]|nr:NFACT RNA binding domain-containing protein [Cyclobacteriaceae bacterium]